MPNSIPNFASPKHEIGYHPDLDNLLSTCSRETEKKLCDVECKFYKKLRYEKPLPARKMLEEENEMEEEQKLQENVIRIHPSIKVINAFEILSIGKKDRVSTK